MNGQVNSLNASVAAAIVIYEAVRQRNGLPSFHKKYPLKGTRKKGESPEQPIHDVTS